jgi:hypothetical protein
MADPKSQNNPFEPENKQPESEEKQTESQNKQPESEEKQPVPQAPSKPREWTPLVAVVATLITATIGSFTTYQASTNQARTQSERSAVEFRKNQQKETYSAYMIDVYELYSAEADILNALNGAAPGPVSDAAIAKEVEKWRDKWQKETKSSYIVLLFASDKTLEVITDIANNVGAVGGSLNKLISVAKSGEFDQNEVIRIDDERTKRMPMQAAFLECARADLGVYG